MNAQRTYVGSKQMQARVRRGLTAYAVRTLRFWQTTIFIGPIGLLIAVAVGGGNWRTSAPLLVLVAFLALLAPVLELRDVARLARTYADPDVTYALSNTDDGFVWQTPTGTYEVDWSGVLGRIKRNGVSIVTLVDSRAICVLPDELLSVLSEQHLAVAARADKRR